MSNELTMVTVAGKKDPIFRSVFRMEHAVEYMTGVTRGAFLLDACAYSPETKEWRARIVASFWYNAAECFVDISGRYAAPTLEELATTLRAEYAVEVVFVR
jgi:hypothetical protein